MTVAQMFWTFIFGTIWLAPLLWLVFCIYDKYLGHHMQANRIRVRRVDRVDNARRSR